MAFHEIDPKTMMVNPFELFPGQWALLTAGNQATGFNTMTAGWGGLGFFGGVNTATVYIRPERYTYDFFNRNDLFTISFYPESCREALRICGSKSGRDCDKVSLAGLTPVELDGTTAFGEAEMVIVCQKFFHTDFTAEGFDDPAFRDKLYPKGEMHRIYLGKVLKIYENK